MLTRGGYIIKKDKLTSIQKKKLTDVLTVSPELQNNGGFANADSFPVFRESNSRYRIPRYYGVKEFGQPINKMPNGISIDVPFIGELKKSTNQDIAVEKALEHLASTGGGILSLPTGFGKTCVSLYILSQLKLKTLIIVHKEFLMNQWIERIRQFLPSASIGIIQQNKVDIVGKDIVIGMLQSLAMKEYDANMFETFGFTIIDETHHISSKIFSKALFNVCTKHMLGLSATPIRKDGLTKVLEWFIGDIFYSIQRENQTSVTVKIHKFKCEEFKNDPPLNKLGKISLSTLINQLTLIEKRNELILKCLIEAMEQKRKVIVLSDRRNHLTTIFNLIKTYDVASVGFYVGGMKQKDLKLSESKQILLGTYTMSSEGMDIPDLDAVIFSSPKSDIIQSLGRILRKKHQTSPIVWDIVDNFSPFINQYTKRRAYYRRMKYSIQICDINDTKELPINDLLTQLENPFKIDSKFKKKTSLKLTFIND